MSKICTPAMVYLVLSIISIILIIFKGMSASTVLVKGLFILAWTWFLNYLCVKGHTGISWFLVLLPFLLMIGMFVMIMEVATNIVKNSNTVNNPNIKKSSTAGSNF